MLTAGLGVLLLAGAAGVLGVRLYMGREAERRVTSEEVADFTKLHRGDEKNVFVMCPATLCADAANLPSPTFNMSWQRLRDFWHEVVSAQPRVELAAREEGGRRLVYIQRSAVFRFPDIVTVEFLPLDDGRSTLAVMSRSRYGREDFGVNAARVEGWTALLQTMMREDQREERPPVSSSR